MAVFQSEQAVFLPLCAKKKSARKSALRINVIIKIIQLCRRYQAR